MQTRHLSELAQGGSGPRARATPSSTSAVPISIVVQLLQLANKQQEQLTRVLEDLAALATDTTPLRALDTASVVDANDSSPNMSRPAASPNHGLGLMSTSQASSIWLHKQLLSEAKVLEASNPALVQQLFSAMPSLQTLAADGPDGSVAGGPGAAGEPQLQAALDELARQQAELAGDLDRHMADVREAVQRHRIKLQLEERESWVAMLPRGHGENANSIVLPTKTWAELPAGTLVVGSRSALDTGHLQPHGMPFFGQAQEVDQQQQQPPPQQLYQQQQQQQQRQYTVQLPVSAQFCAPALQQHGGEVAVQQQQQQPQPFQQQHIQLQPLLQPVQLTGGLSSGLRIVQPGSNEPRLVMQVLRSPTPQQQSQPQQVQVASSQIRQQPLQHCVSPMQPQASPHKIVMLQVPAPPGSQQPPNTQTYIMTAPPTAAQKQQQQQQLPQQPVYTLQPAPLQKHASHSPQLQALPSPNRASLGGLSGSGGDMTSHRPAPQLPEGMTLHPLQQANGVGTPSQMASATATSTGMAAAASPPPGGMLRLDPGGPLLLSPGFTLPMGMVVGNVLGTNGGAIQIGTTAAIRSQQIVQQQGQPGQQQQGQLMDMTMDAQGGWPSGATAGAAGTGAMPLTIVRLPAALQTAVQGQPQ